MNFGAETKFEKGASDRNYKASSLYRFHITKLIIKLHQTH